jgi:chromosome segregation ATPase
MLACTYVRRVATRTLLLTTVPMTQHTTQQSIRSCSLAVALVSFVVLGTLVAITRANAQGAEPASSAADAVIEENTTTRVPARAVREEAAQERREMQQEQYAELQVLRAENQTQRQETVAERREQAQTAVEARRAEMETALSERQAEREARVAEWQARAEERKARLADAAQERLRARMVRVEEALQATMLRLRDAARRIDERVANVEQQGAVQDVAREHLDEADRHMNAMETGITGLTDLADAVFASDDPRSGMEDVRAGLEQIRSDAEAVRGELRAAMESLVS